VWNVILGAVIALVAVLIGYAITQRNAPDDGFKLLLEEIQKFQPRVVKQNAVQLSCLRCEYKTTETTDYAMADLEMNHHLSTAHIPDGEKV